MLETKSSRNRFIASIFVLVMFIVYTLEIGWLYAIGVILGIGALYWAFYKIVMWIDKGR